MMKRRPINTIISMGVAGLIRQADKDFNVRPVHSRKQNQVIAHMEPKSGKSLLRLKRGAAGVATRVVLARHGISRKKDRAEIYGFLRKYADAAFEGKNDEIGIAMHRLLRKLEALGLPPKKREEFMRNFTETSKLVEARTELGITTFAKRRN